MRHPDVHRPFADRLAGSRGGFTLVEVLVVIAIIGVLVGILLPALSRARATAQQVRCASNLRQWGVAFHVYADQYKGLLPHTGDRENGPYYFAANELPVPPVLAGFTPDESGYTYVLPQLLGLPSWLDFPLGQKPTAGLWQCPQAVALADPAYGYAPSRTGYHSYAANQDLDTNTAPLVTADGTVAPAYPPFLNLARARTPSVTLLMFESTLVPADGYGQAPPGTITCMAGECPDTGPAELGDRHPHRAGKLGGNLMFLDGHIEWTDHLWPAGQPTSYVPPSGDRRWWPY